MAEGNITKSKRDLLSDRLSSRYPDKDFSNEDDFYGQISDDYDNYDKELEDYKGREKTFSDMFTSDPRSAKFVTDWRNGEDPTIGLIRQFGPEIKDAIDDPELQDKIAEANKEYIEKVQREKQLDEEYQKNIAETLSTLEQMQKERGMSDEQIDDVMERLIQVVHDGVVGKFTPETINMMLKAMSHDEDVAMASRTGEVKGRNAKINEQLRKANRGDGTAQLDGANNGGGNQRKSNSIFSVAAGAR